MPRTYLWLARQICDRYRVSEYKGKDDNAETLKLSEANVNVYTAGGFTEYRVGRDGFVKVRLRNASACADLVLDCAARAVCWAKCRISMPKC